MTKLIWVNFSFIFTFVLNVFWVILSIVRVLPLPKRVSPASVVLAAMMMINLCMTIAYRALIPVRETPANTYTGIERR